MTRSLVPVPAVSADNAAAALLRLAVVAVSCLVVAALVLTQASGPLRPVAVFWFILFIPGLGLVPLLRLNHGLGEWVLAVALSLALDTAVAGLMVGTGRWSPTAGLFILGGLSLAGATLHFALQAGLVAPLLAVAQALGNLVMAGPAALADWRARRSTPGPLTAGGTTPTKRSASWAWLAAAGTAILMVSSLLASTGPRLTAASAFNRPQSATPTAAGTSTPVPTLESEGASLVEDATLVAELSATPSATQPPATASSTEAPATATPSAVTGPLASPTPPPATSPLTPTGGAPSATPVPPSPTYNPGPGATPTPYNTPVPGASPTAWPTSSAVPTTSATPDGPATKTPKPSKTPPPSNTPRPTTTPRPSTTPTASPTATPTSTVMPTSTASPTATLTPLPSATASATATLPPATATATATTAPSATPADTATPTATNLPLTFTITGRVKGSGGEGDHVDGVAVQLSDGGSTTSDGGGGFAFSGRLPGVYLLVPSKSGCQFSPQVRTVVLGLSDSTGNDFTAHCDEGDSQLGGGQ